MDKTLMDLLIILYDVIDEVKHERLQRRLEQHFVKAVEDLMRLVIIIKSLIMNVKKIRKIGKSKEGFIINRSEKQHYMRQELQKHTSILEQLQSAYKELKNWKILGKKIYSKGC
ncbi:hypothetical protein RhiirA4_476182 [Rhizophagus irregularis]|uniref:Uncharacterized protein n=1 Tax=Rhizophagus irregularis TaxID=588596 RepID=A0A2I1HB65_9GLOM|nr:hypothetical protein RhiirA4_476182 [Rhizophagus irregularis]